jgi:hypothetical protein
MTNAQFKVAKLQPAITRAIADNYYTLAAIEDIADKDFSNEFNAIIDVEELPWTTERYDAITMCEKALFLGYIEIGGATCKVVALMTLGGRVGLYARGAKLSRADHPKIYLQEPWVYLTETVKRAPLENLHALCAYYFVAAQHVEKIWVEKTSFFKTLKTACKLVGRGLGTLGEEEEEEKAAVKEVEEGGAVQAADSGDSGGEYAEGTEEEGIDEEVVAKLLQRLVGFAQGKNAHWAERVEDELAVAWPSVKKHWK